MHPVLFEIPVPELLQGILPSTISIYAYGFFIVLGAISGFLYMATQAKKYFRLSFDQSNALLLLLLIAAIIGGKVFLFFENPSLYSQNPSALISGRGFVFYGSLLFCIPTMLWFFRKHKLPTLPMLDIMAVTTCLVHVFGRMGCFMAGCCYGIPWEGPLAVIFTDPDCLAKPLNTALHPTQLYSASLILSILLILLWLKPRKKFDGQLFLTYLMLYALGRGVIEIFRGDVSRGYVIDDLLSNAQFVSLLIIVVAARYYYKFYKRARLLSPKEAKKS